MPAYRHRVCMCFAGLLSMAILLSEFSALGPETRVNQGNPSIVKEEAEAEAPQVAPPAGSRATRRFGAGLTNSGATPEFTVVIGECKEPTVAGRVRCLLARFPLLGPEGEVNNISELWQGAPLDRFPGTKLPLPVMMGMNGCRAHILLGAAVAGTSSIVEMGTWLGAASVCTAAGVNSSGADAKYFAFDYFKFVGERDKNFYKIGAFKAGNPELAAMNRSSSYFWIWKDLVATVRPPTRIVGTPGYIGKDTAKEPSAWDNLPIDLFLIDSAKDWPMLRTQSHTVWGSLRPGSVVVLSDFNLVLKEARLAVPAFMYGCLVSKGMARFLFTFTAESPSVFEITDAYDAQMVQGTMEKKLPGCMSQNVDAALAAMVSDVEAYTRKSGVLPSTGAAAHTQGIIRNLSTIMDAHKRALKRWMSD